jgi:DNA-binding NarL/FixJ family response regulator
VPRPVQVALANDFEIVVLGLARLLEPYATRVKVVDVVVREQPLHTEVDVVLFDVFAHLNLGFDNIKALVDDPNVAHVAIFTWQLDAEHVRQATAMGVTGYLAKNLTSDELVDALERVAAGEHVVAGHPAADRHSTDRDWPGHAQGLTERESEIIILIAEGHTNAEIAAALHLSPNSVKTHIRSAYRKLRVERRAQAVRTALDLGIARRSADNDRWEALRA